MVECFVVLKVIDLKKWIIAGCYTVMDAHDSQFRRFDNEDAVSNEW